MRRIHTIRQRTGSVSDTHIERCDCTYCDGHGKIPTSSQKFTLLEGECPACEGLGFHLAGDIKTLHTPYRIAA